MSGYVESITIDGRTFKVARPFYLYGECFYISGDAYLDCFNNAQADAEEAVMLLRTVGVGLLARLELQVRAARVPPIEHFMKVVRV